MGRDYGMISQGTEGDLLRRGGGGVRNGDGDREEDQDERGVIGRRVRGPQQPW